MMEMRNGSIIHYRLDNMISIVSDKSDNNPDDKENNHI